jgi:hypothetical protein
VMVSDLRQKFDQWRTDDGSGVEILVTEFEVNSGFTFANPAGKALFAANSYATWLDLGVRSAQWLELHKPTFLSEDASQTRGTAFYAASLVDKFAQAGDEILQAGSNAASISVHAARQADGSIALLLVNTLSGASGNANVTLDLGGALHGTTATRFEYGLSQINAGVGPAQSALSGLDGSVSVFVPSSSIVAIVLDPAAPNADVNGDGVVDGADFLAWQRGAADALTLAFWRAQFGAAPASAAVPEPSAAIVSCCWAFIGAATGRRAMARSSEARS